MFHVSLNCFEAVHNYQVNW